MMIGVVLQIHQTRRPLRTCDTVTDGLLVALEWVELMVVGVVTPQHITRNQLVASIAPLDLFAFKRP